jgi:hypothetical protein
MPSTKRSDVAGGPARRGELHQRLRRASILGAALAGVSLLLAACGGGPAASGVASLGSTTTSASASSAAGNSGGAPSPAETKKLLEFVSCVRAHGVADYPEPLASGGFSRSAMNAVNENSPQYQSALLTCRSLAVASGIEHTPAQVALHDKQLLAYAECMRKQGVTNFPDPVDGGFNISAGNGGFDRTSSRFKRADATCAHLNP